MQPSRPPMYQEPVQISPLQTQLVLALLVSSLVGLIFPTARWLFLTSGIQPPHSITKTTWLSVPTAVTAVKRTIPHVAAPIAATWKSSTAILVQYLQQPPYFRVIIPVCKSRQSHVQRPSHHLHPVSKALRQHPLPVTPLPTQQQQARRRQARRRQARRQQARRQQARRQQLLHPLPLMATLNPVFWARALK